RNDDAARRIAADALPGLDVEAEHQRQAEHRDRDREIVGEPPARHLARAWRRDHALRPGYCDRQSAVGTELPCGAKDDPAGLALDDARVRAGCALQAGIDRHLLERHRLREPDARLGLIDREGPAVAGRVPVERVALREKADLAGGAVA